MFRQIINRRNLAIGSFLLLNAMLLMTHFTIETPKQKPSKFEAEQSKRAEGLRFRRLSLQDEKGRIDPNGLRKAKLHVEEMKKYQSEHKQEQSDEIVEAALAPDSWQWLGPGNVGGRIRSISINPTNANDMLVGSVSGGIWRTTNGGTSWFPVDDFMANLAVSTLVRNPTNANQIYAGTGEGFGNLDAIQGAGIFRSNNGGTSWSQLASTNNPEFNFVNRLAISPNGATILAATNSGVWRSTDGGTNWNPTSGWSTVPQDIDFHPIDNNRAIFGGNAVARYSTDGGATWTTATFNQTVTAGSTLATNGRVELAYAPGSPNIVYASVNNNSGRLFRSTDGGETYDLVSNGTQYLGNQGWYNNIVWVNPQDSDFVVVGGIHLWRSVAGGSFLTQFSDGSDSAHADHHIIVQHPAFNNTTNRIVFFGNDGGIYRTDNVAAATSDSGWTELNNNLGITQFYGAAANTNGVIIGGTQDNGTLRFNGHTEGWTQTFSGDGGFCASDQIDPNFFYGETQNLGVFRSTDAGQTAVDISAGIGDVVPNCVAGGNPPCQTNFIAPLTLDPNNFNTLLAGGWSLWRSNNLVTTPTWTAIKSPTAGNSPISAIAFAPNSSNYIVVGHNNGDIYITFVGTASSPAWTKIDTATLPNRFVTRLTVDHTRSPRWIYATFGGFNGNNVYVSRDQGASWIDITGTGATGLPDVPVRSLVIHPHNRNLLYVGTEVGIFYSNDAGETWELSQGGPANVSVDELFWMGGDLLAATHGRGIYRASGGIYVDCNYIGVQSGTFNQPYRTVNAAINAVVRYTPIWLKPCNYVETINTSKRLEIRNLGGTATITSP